MVQLQQVQPATCEGGQGWGMHSVGACTLLRMQQVLPEVRLMAMHSSQAAYSSLCLHVYQNNVTCSTGTPSFSQGSCTSFPVLATTTSDTASRRQSVHPLTCCMQYH